MIKTIESARRTFRAKSDAAGALWVILGTDSGFEGLTKLYYVDVLVDLEEEG